MPTVVQTGDVFPGNKMYWKFFELLKFAESESYKNIDKASSIKEQWLEFLLDCSKQQEKPDRSEIIKKGYGIMEVAKWDEDKQALYWKEKAEEQDFLRSQEEIKKEEFARGEIKGRIKGEVETVKKLLQMEMDYKVILGVVDFLKQKGEEQALKNITLHSRSY